jgi:hypothetical protein
LNLPFSPYPAPEHVNGRVLLEGYHMLVKNKKEPWGQTVSRFLAREGLLVGITYTPSMRDEE